jgi:hypothetical protein
MAQKVHLRPTVGKTTATDIPPELVSGLLKLVGAFVDDALRRAPQDHADDPLIRSDRLGPNNRIVRGLIDRGELAAVKIGSRWHVRRSEWERYTRELEGLQRSAKLATEAGNAANDGGADDVAGVLQELGLERVETPLRAARTCRSMTLPASSRSSGSSASRRRSEPRGRTGR